MFRRFLSFTVLLSLMVALVVPVAAQGEITLVPYTDEAYGLQGLIPDGWTKAGPGVYVRAATPDDPTTLALHSAAATTDDMMQALLPQFALTSAPEPVGTQQTDAFTWTLYQFDSTVGGADLAFNVALAEADGTTYLTLLITSPDEVDALHESVFLPVLEAVAPLEVVEEEVPYIVEEVTFTNGDVTLAGTLTIPDTAGEHPAVVLMTGSGPQDRDEMVVPGFRIFRLIADHLTRQGIAVLRYDDRGVGESTGEYNEASLQVLASDGLAGVAYLHERDDIDAGQVGVIGHSEGGVYAAMIGANPDSGVAFIVSLAGIAVPGTEILKEQNRALLTQAGMSEEVIDLQMDYLDDLYPLIVAQDWDAAGALAQARVLDQWEMLSDEEREALGGDAEAFASQSWEQARQTMSTGWYRTLLDYDAAVDWAQTTVPVLAIFGAKDIQVDEVQNAAPMMDALIEAGNTDFAVVVLPDANHLFQSADTGALEEYATLPPEFTPDLLPTLTTWLLQHITVVEG